jgi:hypothetical protein
VSATGEVLDAVERAVASGAEADDVLRTVVAILHEHLDRFVRISFVEGERLEPGPAAGEPTAVSAYAVSWGGRPVAQLEVGGEAGAGERELLERVAVLVSPHALVGWDTRGEAWTP